MINESIDDLTKFIQSYAPDVKLTEYVGSEAKYTLPFSSGPFSTFVLIGRCEFDF